MKKIFNTLRFLPLIALAIACGEDASKNQTAIQPIEVTTQSVAAQSNNPWVTASGSIEAVNSATLSTRLMGFVENIPVSVGQKVSRGQLLVQLNSTDLSAKRAQANAAITEAKAAFQNAEKNYTRFQNLFQQNSASQKELDDMTAHWEMAKARLEAVQQMKNEVDAQFAYTNIRSPFSGTVTNRFVDEGAMAKPGMPLISVEGPNSFEARVSVPESEITKINQGDTVNVQVKSTGVQLKGQVSELSGSAVNTGGQYIATVSLLEKDPTILSGMYVNVQFPVKVTETMASTLTIPKSALVYQGQLSGIYTVSESGTALLRWLRLGRSFGESVEVLSGLKPGERYIVSAKGKLYNGALISVQ